MYDRDTTRAAISAADAVMATVKKAGAAGAPLGAIYAALLQEHIDCSYSELEALRRPIFRSGTGAWAVSSGVLK